MLCRVHSGSRQVIGWWAYGNPENATAAIELVPKRWLIQQIIARTEGRATCLSKKRYQRRWQAAQTATFLRRYRQKTHAEVFPYRCHVCFGWHLSKFNRES
jgi:hypothetical protein